MKRRYYLIIATAVLATIVVLSMLNYTALQILYAEYSNSHNINVFFITRHGKLIQNVSVSLFAFYPTPNGTVIKEIYYGHNLKYLSIPVSNLTWYAKQWLGTYNYTIVFANGTKVIKKHIKYNASLIIPSLIGFASYYIVNQSNGTITIYTQPFSVRVSPHNITHGIGKTVIRAFVNPIVKIIKLNESNSSTSSNVVTPQQTTITVTTTTVPKTTSSPGPSDQWKIYYFLDTYWIWPNNSSRGELGPFPLSLVYVTDPNGNDYEGNINLVEGERGSSGVSISFGITLAYGALSLQIFGTSIAFNGGSVSFDAQNSFGWGVPYSPTNYPWSYPYFADIETFAQFATAIYTAVIYWWHPGYYNWVPYGRYNVTMFFITGLLLAGENGVYLPALYNLSLYDLTNPQSFFNGGKLIPLMTIYPGQPLKSSAQISIVVNTPEGFVSGAIPLQPLFEYVSDTYNEVIPDEILDVVSPYVAIVPFTSSTQAYASFIAMRSLSNNIYYVYYENISVPYNISGINYYLPTFYYYVNYTTS